MVGLQNFIIKSTHEYNETFETNGVKLYGDKRFLQSRLANLEVEVVEIPALNYKGPIEKGDRLIIDLSVFLRFISTTGEIENNYTIDKKKGLYQIPISLVHLYSKSNNNWIGHDTNLFVEKVTEPNENQISSIIYIPKDNKAKEKYYIKFINKELEEMGVNIGDRVMVNESMLMPVYVNGKEYFHLNTHDIVAVYGEE